MADEHFNEQNTPRSMQVPKLVDFRELVSSYLQHRPADGLSVEFMETWRPLALETARRLEGLYAYEFNMLTKAVLEASIVESE